MLKSNGRRNWKCGLSFLLLGLPWYAKNIFIKQIVLIFLDQGTPKKSRISEFFISGPGPSILFVSTLMFLPQCPRRLLEIQSLCQNSSLCERA